MSDKEFTVGGGEDVTFTLVGTDAAGKKLKPMKFHCLPNINGTVLANTVSKLQEGGTFALQEIADFIKHALRPDEEERWEQVATGKDVLVDIGVISGIMTYLVEQYAKRPTETPSSFSNGQAPMVSISGDGATFTPSS